MLVSNFRMEDDSTPYVFSMPPQLTTPRIRFQPGAAGSQTCRCWSWRPPMERIFVRSPRPEVDSW